MRKKSVTYHNKMQSSSVKSDVTNRNTTELTAEETALAPSIQNDHELRVPFYCEENVWRIAYRKVYYPRRNLMKTNDTFVNNERYMVVFISNLNKRVPMYHQLASASTRKPCCWDYHVILLGVNTVTTNTSTDTIAVHVYDVDTTLTPYPTPLTEYLASSFPLDYVRYPEFQPYFRVIPADKFIQHFKSDRSHMYNPITKSYNEPPPSYACITLPKSDPSNIAIDNNSETHDSTKSNFSFYLNFTQIQNSDISLKDDIYGTIVSLEELYKFNFS
jgi:protein N-terminal glutamine amidohydrolase